MVGCAAASPPPPLGAIPAPVCSLRLCLEQSDSTRTVRANSHPKVCAFVLDREQKSVALPDGEARVHCPMQQLPQLRAYRHANWEREREEPLTAVDDDDDGVLEE